MLCRRRRSPLRQPETLRVSPFAANNSRSLKHVLEQAERVDRRLADTPAFRNLIGLLQQVEHVRLYSRGG